MDDSGLNGEPIDRRRDRGPGQATDWEGVVRRNPHDAMIPLPGHPQHYPEGDEHRERLVCMDSQQVRDVFLEALAEISGADDGGLFARVVYQLSGASDITETDAGEVTIDATALVEGALEAMAVLGGAWAADHRVTLQIAGRHFLDALRASE